MCSSDLFGCHPDSSLGLIRSDEKAVKQPGRDTARFLDNEKLFYFLPDKHLAMCACRPSSNSSCRVRV